MFRQSHKSLDCDIYRLNGLKCGQSLGFFVLNIGSIQNLFNSDYSAATTATGVLSTAAVLKCADLPDCKNITS